MAKKTRKKRKKKDDNWWNWMTKKEWMYFILFGFCFNAIYFFKDPIKAFLGIE